MTNLGTMALEDGGRIDFTRLRRERRDRVFAEMGRRGIDALILAREGNARYVAGARRLWTAGTRPFGPGCLVIRATRQVHLLSVWDDGIPPEIPHENLFGISWNPMNLMASLQKIPGLAEAETLGVDGMSPLFSQLLPMAAPRAQLVDGNAALRAARRIKTADEVACIRTAIAITEGALSATLPHLRPGVTERELIAQFLGAMASLGVTAPALDPAFTATPVHGVDASAPGLRRIATERPIGSGELVAVDAGVMYAGYEGGIGRTWACLGHGATPSQAQEAVHARRRAVLDAMLERCTPGAPASGLRDAYGAAGEPVATIPAAYGLGLGVEPPVVHGAGDAPLPSETLEPGMVLALQAYVWADGVGGSFGREVALVGDSGPEVLTHLP